MSVPQTTNFFQRVQQRRGVRQFVKFGIVGASGFLVNLVIFTLLQRVVPNHQAAGPYYAIYSVAFLGGGVSNYFLNRVWTFRSTGHAGKEAAQFLSVSVLALLVGLVVSALVAPWLGHGHKTWFLATVSGIVVNFFVNKYWTFRSVA
ncbi:MAG: GtrA family protein [Candidatus Eremiobacteraeota bacterium]|nr:GtrA family protein [Candidatus Eremiobacteraeota bacterium]MBV9407736.1 GtrA family protein [Candidatus Eremiobacteraeota bacterium]